MEIPKLPTEGCCHVKFSFAYGKKRNRHKKYYGQLVLSRKHNGGAYCTLVNHGDQGEITYLVMVNPIVNNGSVCCVTALVATISGGKDTKHPCAERMIISRVPLQGPRFELVKAHLLLNDKNIRITEEAFLSMLHAEEIPKEFKQRYQTEHPFDEKSLSDYLTRTAIIPESWVKSLTSFSEENRQKIIDLLRLHSSAPKYNKIKQKQRNMIYSICLEKNLSRGYCLLSRTMTVPSNRAIFNCMLRPPDFPEALTFESTYDP